MITTGMGQGNARQAIKAILAEGHPSWVLTCGLAGGLNPALDRGAVVYEADEAFLLTSALRRAGAKPVRFYCATRVIATAQAKLDLGRVNNADVVDMESAVIRQECRSRQIPSATVRVISDPASEDLPLDFNRYVEADNRLNYAKILVAVLRRPSLIPALLQFQRQTQVAARLLADALARVLTDQRP